MEPQAESLPAAPRTRAVATAPSRVRLVNVLYRRTPAITANTATLPALPWRALAAVAFRWWAMTRLATVLIVWGVATLFQSGASGFSPTQSLFRGSVSPRALVAGLAPWDAGIFYLPIALSGYTRQAQVAFWPLYPSLIHIGLWLTAPWGAWDSTHALLVGLAISNLATLAAFLGLAALVWQETGKRVWAERAVRALALSPFAFWLALPYSDSLFLALAMFSLLALRRKRWYTLAVLSYVAALARPTSAALALAIGVAILAELVRALRDPVKRRALGPIAPRVAALLGAPVGAGVWLMFCALAFPQWGGWSAPLQASRKVFGHQLTLSGGFASVGAMWSDLTAAPLLSFMSARLLMDAAPWLFSLALCIIACVGITHRRAGRLAWPLALYAVMATAITIWSPITHQMFADPILSAGRYALAAAPLALTWVALCRQSSRVGRWTLHWGRWLETLEVTVAPLLQALLLIFVLRGGWLV